jgi:hypothetical protein
MLRTRFVLLLIAYVKWADAHSWIEQLTNVSPNGLYTGPYGYPRMFVDKTASATFNQNSNLWLIPAVGLFVTQTDLLCHPSQRDPSQSSRYPRLQTLPGNTIALRYAENGHVTIPGGGKNLLGKPDLGGTVFVFGTQQPSREEKLVDVLQWTADNMGGDRRGVLLASQNFDDGRCYQLGNGAALANARKSNMSNLNHEVLCESDVKLPTDVSSKQPYTLYWVWQWANSPLKDPNLLKGKDEYYSSCIDVDFVLSVPPNNTILNLVQQDPMTAAVGDFRSRTALTNNPLALYSQSGFGGLHLSSTYPSITTSVTTFSQEGYKPTPRPML